jgi:hypothetical protein
MKQCRCPSPRVRRQGGFPAILAAFFLAAIPVRADVLFELPESNGWVTANQQPGGGWPAWSMDTARTPATNVYFGPAFYGGATSSLSKAFFGVQNASPDYFSAGTATAGTNGSWLVFAPMFKLAGTYTLTNLAWTARTGGTAANYTNWWRLIVQQDGSLYVSETRTLASSTNLLLGGSAISNLNWYTYDPTTDMAGDTGSPVAAFEPTAITAVGLVIDRMQVVDPATSINTGFRYFYAAGFVAIPEPSAAAALLAGAGLWLALRRRA